MARSAGCTTSVHAPLKTNRLSTATKRDSSRCWPGRAPAGGSARISISNGPKPFGTVTSTLASRTQELHPRCERAGPARERAPARRRTRPRRSDGFFRKRNSIAARRETPRPGTSNRHRFAYSMLGPCASMPRTRLLPTARETRERRARLAASRRRGPVQTLLTLETAHAAEGYHMRRALWLWPKTFARGSCTLCDSILCRRSENQ